MRAALLVLLFLSTPSFAETVDAFYRGRTVQMIIGYSVGGGYDLYARLLANHISRHIPGNPTIVPQNMPGAGSMLAANYLYSVAAKDGSVIGTFGRSIALAPLFGGAPFDATKFAWLGSITKDVSLCVAWHTSPIKSWDDVFTKEWVLGGEGAGADPDIFAHAIKNLFGAKIRLITGFPGTNDTAVAMERGEVDGLCGLSVSTLKTRHPDWVTADKARIIVQAALEKDPGLPDVPLLIDLAKEGEQRQAVKLVVAGQLIARPFTAPPGIPEDRRAALRRAFDATMEDPAFRADAQRLAADVDPVGGAQIEALLQDLYATPKDVIAAAAKAVAN